MIKTMKERIATKIVLNKNSAFSFNSKEPQWDWYMVQYSNPRRWYCGWLWCAHTPVFLDYILCYPTIVYYSTTRQNIMTNYWKDIVRTYTIHFDKKALFRIQIHFVSSVVFSMKESGFVESHNLIDTTKFIGLLRKYSAHKYCQWFVNWRFFLMKWIRIFSTLNIYLFN